MDKRKQASIYGMTNTNRAMMFTMYNHRCMLKSLRDIFRRLLSLINFPTCQPVFLALLKYFWEYLSQSELKLK